MDFSTDVTEVIKQIIPSAVITCENKSKHALYIHWDTPNGRMHRCVFLPRLVRDIEEYDQKLSDITNDLKTRFNHLSSELDNVPCWDYSEPIISLN